MKNGCVPRVKGSWIEASLPQRVIERRERGRREGERRGSLDPWLVLREVYCRGSNPKPLIAPAPLSCSHRYINNCGDGKAPPENNYTDPAEIQQHYVGDVAANTAWGLDGFKVDGCAQFNDMHKYRGKGGFFRYAL